VGDLHPTSIPRESPALVPYGKVGMSSSRALRLENWICMINFCDKHLRKGLVTYFAFCRIPVTRILNWSLHQASSVTQSSVCGEWLPDPQLWDSCLQLLGQQFWLNLHLAVRKGQFAEKPVPRANNDAPTEQGPFSQNIRQRNVRLSAPLIIIVIRNGNRLLYLPQFQLGRFRSIVLH
jgi:hypothetical protein